MALKLGKCRLCLKLGDFYSIFTVDNSVQLAEMVTECARVKIQEGDGLPDKICAECIQKLSSAYIFKQQCERSDQELRRNYVPPPGFKASPPSPNRQSSDSAFSNHTDISHKTKPLLSADGYTTPAPRARKRSHESIESSKHSSTTKRISQLRDSEKKPRLIQSATTSQAESDFDDDYAPSPSQYSMDSDSDVPPAMKYPCKLCPKEYDNAKSYASHMKTHKNKKDSLNSPPVTNIPNKSTDDAEDVENKLKCDKCNKTFKLQIMLKRHGEICGKSPIKSPQKELLVTLEPIDGIVSKRIECEYCSARFKTTDNLEKHLRVIHAAILKKKNVVESLKSEDKDNRSNLGVATMPCIFCHKEFQDYHIYSSHFNTCPKKSDLATFECPLCQKSLTKKAGFVSHVKRIHFDNFPALGKGIKTPNKSLNNSLLDSSSTEPEVKIQGSFACRMCSKKFSNEQALITHLKGHLSSAEDDESRSSTIDDSASQHSEYSNSRVSGGKPLACSQCDRRFKYHKALVTHQLVAHLKKEPPDEPPEAPPPPPPPPPRAHRTLVSPAPSASSASDSAPEDNTCDICEKQFSYRRLLLQHKRTKHNMSSGHKRAKINLKECSVRCLICDVEMKVSAINQHNQTHIAANIKPRNIYTCAECGERFKSCSALASHIKLIHRLKQPAAPADLGGAELADFCEVVVTKAEPLDGVQSHNGLPEVPPASVDGDGFNCPVCTKRMKTILALKRHMNWHNVIGNNITKSIECFVCKETFRFKSHYKVHMSAHYKDPNVDPALLTCEICGRRSKHLRAAQMHMNFHKQTRFQTKDYCCSICKRVFEHRKVYLSHMAIHYKRGDTVSNIVVGSAPSAAAAAAAAEGSYICHMCNKPCESETALKCHMSWHNSKSSLFGARHECPLCGLHFTNKKRCELHVREHYESEDGPYKCTICGKGFIDEEFFKRHVKGHNFDHQSHKKRIEKLRKDKVKCPICPRYYPDMLKLIRHLRRTHPESKMIKQDPDAPAPKYFACKLCAQVFLDERRLKNHEERHLRKPGIYKCKFCRKSSYSMKQHNIHIKGHLTKKYIDEPLKCYECDEQFVKGYALHHHLRDIHGIRETWVAAPGTDEHHGPLQEFQCSVCYKVLASRGNFERHIDFHNSLRCNYCFEYFTALRFLEGHLEYSCDKRKLIGYTEVYPKKVKCHICYKAFHVQVKLDCHLRTQHNIKVSKEISEGKQELVCDYCFRVFENEDALIGHKVYHRTVGYYGCIYCNRKFNTLTLYRKHKNHHFSQLNVDNPTKCEHCDETFVAFREMIYHMRDVHNDDKEWVILPKETIEEKCNICNKIFFNLQRHLSYHEENRCKKCCEYFYSRIDFDNHLCTIESDDETLVNDGNDVRPKYEECSFCFKPITRTSSKSKHDQIHKSSGSISCRFCNHKFKTIDAFNIHAFSHRSRKYNKKPIVCRKCGEKFVKYGPFVKHLKNVHKSKKKMHYRAVVKAETCVVCGDDFPNLHNHYRAHVQNQCSRCRKYFTSYRVFSQHQCDKEDLDPSKVYTSDADLHYLINTYVPKDEKDDEKFYGYDGDMSFEVRDKTLSNNHDDESQQSCDNSNLVGQSPVISDILSLYQIKKDEYESQDSQNADDISQNGNDNSQDADDSRNRQSKHDDDDDDVVHVSEDEVGMTDRIPVVITIDDDDD